MFFIIAAALFVAQPDVTLLSAHIDGCAACKKDEPKLAAIRRHLSVEDLTESQARRRGVKEYPTYIVLKSRKEVYRGTDINEAIKNANRASKERPPQ